MEVAANQSQAAARMSIVNPAASIIAPSGLAAELHTEVRVRGNGQNEESVKTCEAISGIDTRGQKIGMIDGERSVGREQSSRREGSLRIASYNKTGDVRKQNPAPGSSPGLFEDTREWGHTIHTYADDAGGLLTKSYPIRTLESGIDADVYERKSKKLAQTSQCRMEDGEVVMLLTASKHTYHIIELRSVLLIVKSIVQITHMILREHPSMDNGKV
ncbi:hypothetical protein EDD15DRAFT_2199721 [Pisolithus albus]|nr:hypothetical protein EDD15DRAFT_2199721 [Pisolithus albus]